MSDLILGPLQLAGLALVVVLVAGWLVWRWWRKRRHSSIGDALKAIAVAHLEDVLVPDGMDGEIHIEHLVLTKRGVLVLNIKHYKGVVFASDRMDQWTAIDKGERSTFQNPLSSLYDRVAAIRQLVRDIEVEGFVVFPSLADFSKGRPRDVRQPEDLLQVYARPDKADVDRLTDAFQPHWEKIRQAVRPARA